MENNTPVFLHTSEFVKPVTLRIEPDAPSWQRVLRVIEDHDGVTSREISERIGILEPTVQSCIQKLRTSGNIKRAPKIEGDRRVRWIVGAENTKPGAVDRSAGMTQRIVKAWAPMKVQPQTPFSALFGGV